jgi:hypothetical protein
MRINGKQTIKPIEAVKMILSSANAQSEWGIKAAVTEDRVQAHFRSLTQRKNEDFNDQNHRAAETTLAQQRHALAAEGLVNREALANMASTSKRRRGMGASTSTAMV